MLMGTFVYVGLFWLASAASTDTYGASAEQATNAFWLIILGWNVLLLVATVLVVVDSVRKVRAGNTRALATGVFMTKLAAIPFFLINFGIWALAGLAGLGTLVHGIGVFILVTVVVAIVLTYLAMISTSVYGWASVIALRRERSIGIGLAALYTILLFVFVADTVAGIMLFAHTRRGRASAPAGVPVLEA